MQDDKYLPSRLTINLGISQQEREYWGGPNFLATTSQFPDLTAESGDAEEAIANLLWSILDTQDLSDELVQALKDAGHSEDVVSAWDDLARGRLNRRYRYDAHAAVQVLKEYTDGGVPALTACQYLDLLIEPSLAIEAHANGGTPDDALSYINHSETHKWFKWDYDIDPWIRSGFPFERGRMYANDCSVEDAREWEQIGAEHHIADSVIADLLRAKFTPATARQHLRTDGHDASSLVGEALRRLAEFDLAWSAPVTGGNPWGDDNEPPF